MRPVTKFCFVFGRGTWAGASGLHQGRPRWATSPAFRQQHRPCCAHAPQAASGLVTLRKASACSKPAVERFYTEFARCACLPSQRSFHSAPIFRLLLKVAVNGTHQCDSNNFCGASSSNNKLTPTDNEGSVRQLGNAGGNIVDCRCSCHAGTPFTGKERGPPPHTLLCFDRPLDALLPTP